MNEQKTLRLVETADDPNVNVLLYGPPKTGKTVGAASLPGPLLYLNSDRPNATRFAHRMFEFDEARLTGLPTLIQAMHEIDTGDYNSVVVDTIGEMYTAVLDSLSGHALRPAINLRGDTSTHLERFCKALCEKPVNVCFVCHELPTTDEDSGVIERLPFTGTKNPVFGQKLMAMVDVIAYTGIISDDDQQKRYVGQLIDAKGRRGGDRSGVLGDLRDLQLSEWVTEIRDAEQVGAAA